MNEPQGGRWGGWLRGSVLASEHVSPPFLLAALQGTCADAKDAPPSTSPNPDTRAAVSLLPLAAAAAAAAWATSAPDSPLVWVPTASTPCAVPTSQDKT